MLMGRRTYEVVDGFEGPWPYGETPLLVATRRELSSDRPQVRAVAGAIGVLIEQAREAAGKADVYLDGGELIRQALTAGLVDEVTITVVPEILGAGIPLFSGLSGRHSLRLIRTREVGGGLVELVYEPLRE
jgi:dihydrofolate reductase